MSEYYDYVLERDARIIRDVQNYCADLASSDEAWGDNDAWNIAQMLNTSANPMALFRFMDERTGSHYVGYKTEDGREWFHILRQMRNTREGGLFEHMRK